MLLIVLENKKTKELLLLVYLSSFFMTTGYLTSFASYYLYIVSLLIVLMLYVLRKIFPIINKSFKRPVTARKSVFYFVAMLFTVAILNILNFKTGIVLEPQPTYALELDKFSPGDLLKVISIVLIVLSITFARFEEEQDVH